MDESGWLLARNLAFLGEAELLSVLKMRNHREISKWMTTSRKITQKEHFAFVEGLKSAKNQAYFLVSAGGKGGESLGEIFDESSRESRGGAGGIFGESWRESCESNGESFGKSHSAKNPESRVNLGVFSLNHIDLANKNAFFGIYANPALLFGGEFDPKSCGAESFGESGAKPLSESSGAARLERPKNAPNFRPGHRIFGALRHLAFERLGLNAIYARVLEPNARALRFYEKEGLARCGILPLGARWGGGFIDVILMAKLAKNAPLEGKMREGK